ncbi:CHAT domain-containing tetratricopeptide repeat protein [Mesorhizobium sp. B2-3-12]|uniref:CHAT domain-containing tetratricopeptide repeat protein n=1 Tax=Mesorhizobium sp. B2-3-12 TaxID=2589952 RepID=UPI00112CCC68|nr:CHAT domain-containing tetratricopeptide repeat protein [Mesorhizobium sp. B2-3-12]TPL95532.1 CHAT domain-containing protein [Mesorhizobium sp. B2-3-12]
MARPDLATICSPRRRIVRLALAGALTFASATAALAEQASPATGARTSTNTEAAPWPPEIQAIETAIRKSDFAGARKKALALMDGSFARRDPKAAAYAGYMLARADMFAGEWQDLHDTLIGRADGIIRDLDQTRADEFALLLADAAGRIGRADEQDRLLDLRVEAIAQRSGPDSEDSLNARVDAAYSQLTAKRADVAEKRLLSALNAMELGGHGDLFFKTVGQAGDSFNRFADADAAQRIFQRGLDSNLMETDTGPGPGFLQFNLAAFLRDQKEYDQANRFGLRALNILADHFGMGSTEALSAYDGLAQTLHAWGQLASAEAAYQFIYETGLKSLGEDNADLWRMMNNRAAVLRSLKLPAAALEFDKYAYDKRFKALGGGAGDTVISAMNMAHDLLEAERWKDARSVLAVISGIVVQPGFNEGYRRQIERWQAYAQLRLGERQLSRKQIQARDTTDFTDRADIEQSLAFFDLFADKAEAMGLTEDAEAYREHAVAIAKESLGDAQPMTFEAELAQARLQEKMDPKAAVDSYRKLDAVMFDWGQSSVSASGSLRAGQAERVLADDMLGSLADFATRNADAADLFAAMLDNWKTLTRGAERQLRAEAETSDDKALRDLIKTYFSNFGRFREVVTATLYTDALAPQRQAMEDSRKALNAALEKRAEQPVASWIYSAPQEAKPLARPAEGDVIVDLAIIGEWPADRGGTPDRYRVFATISRASGPAQVIEVDAVDARKGKTGSGQSFTAKLATVLGDAAKDAKALYVIPADFLYQVDFAELRPGGGKRLGELVDMHTATSRQAYEFRARQDRPSASDAMLLAGGLFYGNGVGDGYLPGSRTEVEKIAKLARDKGMAVRLAEGNDGGEAAMRAAADGKAIVHFSTHGFFERGEGLSERLMNAGFVLSDAKPADEPKEWDGDNIVYARELLSWNLRSSQLVVVSACDTALGDIGVTSTVRGLPLALSVAGARRTLLTVEEVDDAATMQFMARFYENLFDGRISYADAFIKTKREAWAGKIDGFAPELTSAYILFEH